MLEHVHLYTLRVLLDAYMPEQPAYFHTVLTKSTRRRSVWCIEHHLQRKSLRVLHTITKHYTISKNEDNTHYRTSLVEIGQRYLGRLGCPPTSTSPYPAAQLS